MHHKIRLFLKLALFLLLLSTLSLGLFFGFVYFGAFGTIYTSEELRAFENQYGSTVLSADGRVLGHFYDVNRTQADFKELPDYLIEALLATEDIRFFDHEGVDFRSLLRVLVRTLIMGDRSGGGGSTITQQLAKNMYGRPDHEFMSMPINKMREIILAHRMESTFSKREILVKYLNTVSFGEDIYGIKMASQRYFDKVPADLELQEAATLIGILKATHYYNPRLNPENALNRRNTVLSQMGKYDYISRTEMDSLKTKPLGLRYRRSLEVEGSGYFVAQVRRKAQELLRNGSSRNLNDNWSLETDGLIIETTLDLQLQSYAFQAMLEQVRKMQPYLTNQYQSGSFRRSLDSLIVAQYGKLGLSKDSLASRAVFSWDTLQLITAKDSVRLSLLQLQAGVLAMDPKTGALLAYVGGLDFARQPFDQVQAPRQLASTFKPVLYAAAFAAGKLPCDYVSNESFILTDYEDWQPENYNKETGGKYSLAAALAFSKNIPAVRLLFELGFDKVGSVWESLGFSEDFPENPSIALGAVEASLYELISGYSAFARQGVRTQPHLIKRILSRDGEVLYEHESEAAKKVLDPAVAWQVSSILQKAVNEGTGRSLRSHFGLKMPLAGKTGTSQNFADAWFVGYNPNLIIAARVGANFPAIHFATGVYGSGSALALPIVGKTLQQVEKDSTMHWLAEGNFAAASDELNCPDFEEATGMEKFLKIFQRKKTTLEKEQKKANKKGFFKRLFEKKE